MLSLSLLFWSTFVVALISFWWQSDRIKSTALTFVTRHCKDQQLQLLDQTMVLKGVWPVRDETGTLKIRRRYGFEFTSTGEARYQGTVILIGLNLRSLEMDAYIIPDDQDSLM